MYLQARFDEGSLDRQLDLETPLADVSTDGGIPNPSCSEEDWKEKF